MTARKAGSVRDQRKRNVSTSEPLGGRGGQSIFISARSSVNKESEGHDRLGSSRSGLLSISGPSPGLGGAMRPLLGEALVVRGELPGEKRTLLRTALESIVRMVGGRELSTPPWGQLYFNSWTQCTQCKKVSLGQAPASCNSSKLKYI